MRELGWLETAFLKKQNSTSTRTHAPADTDGDGTVNCEDLCPDDPAKTDPGFCGCGVKDTFPCPGDLTGKKKGSSKRKGAFKKSKGSAVYKGKKDGKKKL